eukprot:TCONS_00011758-protein
MLTEEQKKKIEENRRKALEKRKRKKHTSPNRSCIPENISSPPFKKRPINNTTTDGSLKAHLNTVDIGPITPPKKTLPQTSYSPSFKKKCTEATNGVSDGFAFSPQKNLLRQTSYSPSFKRKTADISSQEQKTIDNNDHFTLTPERKAISKTSYSSLFKNGNDLSTNNTMLTSSCACPSQQSFQKKVSSPEKKSIPKTSYSPSFKKSSNNPENGYAAGSPQSLKSFEKSNTSPEKKVLPTTSYSPSFKKSSSTQDESQRRSFSAKRTIEPDLTHSTIKNIVQGEGQSQEQLTRSEINRMKALEKLKMKQNETISTSSSSTTKITSPQRSRSIFNKELSQKPEEVIEVAFSVNSPTWIRLHSQSNDKIHSIIKRFNTNFDKGNWLFHVKDYKEVVSCFENIANIKIKESIPSSVVKILHYAHEEQKRKPSDKIDLSKIEENILKKLMPFQKTGVQFAIQKKGRVLIADDMGLGKTVQTIAICNYYIEDWPVLIICPSSVKMSWQQHFLSWMPTLRESDISIIHTGKEKIRAVPGSITIVSCDLASKFANDIQNCGFQIIIVDESHALKNSQAKRTKNLLPILQNSRRTILLSGTPALSRPKELFTQISALRRELFKSYFKFAKRYCDAREGRYGLEDDGCSNSDELNAILKSTVMLRRMKYEVLDQLPSKIRQILILDPSFIKISKQFKTLEKAFVASRRTKENRTPLLQYYSATAEVKVGGVVQFISEKLESTTEKIIVFAHHLTMLDQIEEETRCKNIESIRISGTTGSKARQSLVDIFNNTASCRLAILSITAAGTGLNMTASSLVIFAELYWNPGHLIQAEDRAYRIGQKKSVSVIYLIARQTADDWIWPLIKNKLNVLTNLGVGTTKGLSDAKCTEAEKKITDFFGSNSHEDDDGELDELLSNLQHTFDDDLMLEISQRSS